jgi:peptidoglycan/LPS O-acetylase OafA/YrhL
MQPEAHAAHRPEIDGLRAVAVLAVLIFHLNRLWLPGGFAGVDVFFTLSGYLVTGILLRSKDLGTFSLADFWQRRLARIFPAFFAMAVTTLTVAFFLYDDWDFASTGAAFTAALSAWANHHQLSLGGYFSLSDDTQPLLHTWSLAVEEQFYLLFPLCFLGRSSASPRQRLALTATASLLSFASCLWLASRHPSLGFYLLPSRAWELLAGSLLAITHHHRLLPAPAQPQRFTNVGTALILLSFLVLHEHQPFPGWRALLPVLGTAAILHGGPAGLAGRSLASTPATYLGRLSYSLYLWHWPVFSFIDYHFLFSPNATRLSLKILLTAIAALTCHHALEIPLRSLLRHPNRRRFVWLATAAALLIGIPSGLLIRRHFYKDGTDSPSGILVISPSTPNPARRPIILIGDSQATMYSRVLADIANARGQSLIILSAAGGDPLAPPPGSPPSDLWNLCLSTAQREHPATIVLSCHWIYKLGNHPHRLSRTLDALSPLADHLVILYQPPIPPHSASRQAIRLGSRPPFFESPEDATARQRAADLVSIVAGGRLNSIIDTVPLFTTPDGAVRAFSPDLHPLFHDRAHLSSSGAALVRPHLETACSFTRRPHASAILHHSLFPAAKKRMVARSTPLFHSPAYDFHLLSP